MPAAHPSGGARLPLILQTEVAECGLATMVLASICGPCVARFPPFAARTSFKTLAVGVKPAQPVDSAGWLAQRLRHIDLAGQGSDPCALGPPFPAPRSGTMYKPSDEAGRVGWSRRGVLCR